MNPSRSSRNIGGSRAEAERRRALALKALDQRLQTGGPATAGGATKPSGGRTPGVGTTPSVQTPSLGAQGQATAAGLGETTYTPEEQPAPRVEEKQAQA